MTVLGKAFFLGYPKKNKEGSRSTRPEWVAIHHGALSESLLHCEKLNVAQLCYSIVLVVLQILVSAFTVIMNFGQKKMKTSVLRCLRISCHSLIH